MYCYCHSVCCLDGRHSSDPKKESKKIVFGPENNVPYLKYELLPSEVRDGVKVTLTYVGTVVGPVRLGRILGSRRRRRRRSPTLCSCGEGFQNREVKNA